MTYYEWAKKNSPPAFMMMNMNMVWEIPNEDEEKVARSFLKYWDGVKAFIKAQNEREGIKSLSDYHVPFEPSKKIADGLTTDFFNLIWSIDTYLSNTRLYRELISYYQDLLDLFTWSQYEHDQWLSHMGVAIWKLDPAEGERFFKERLNERNDVLMFGYAACLMGENRWDEMEERLKGYEDTTDETLLDRFMFLAMHQSEVLWKKIDGMLRERLDKAEHEAGEMIRTMYKENRFIPALFNNDYLVTVTAEEKDYALCASDYERREYAKEGYFVSESPMQEILPDIKEKSDIAGIAIVFPIEDGMTSAFPFSWDDIGLP